MELVRHENLAHQSFPNYVISTRGGRNTGLQSRHHGAFQIFHILALCLEQVTFLTGTEKSEIVGD